MSDERNNNNVRKDDERLMIVGWVGRLRGIGWINVPRIVPIKNPIKEKHQGEVLNE